MKWNRNEWQGKSKEQVEYSYKAGFYATVILTIVFGVLLLISLSSCKSTEKIDCDAYSMVKK
jgi:hypothetical protein